MTVYEQILKANSLDKQMTISETAKYLNLSTQTVRKQIKTGRIKATSHNKQFRILKAQFHDCN
jgi:excisionase family DNA binding protein